MIIEKLGRTQVKILRIVVKDSCTISQVAEALERSHSWTSLSIGHIVRLGMVKLERNGVTKRVGPTGTPLGQSMVRLFRETPFLNLDIILPGPGLALLPLLLPPGGTEKEIAQRTGLSHRTVHDRFRIWRTMGFLHYDRSARVYRLNDRYAYLVEFVENYSLDRNHRFASGSSPAAIVVWQWRDEVLVSSEKRDIPPQFIPGAISELERLGYDLVSSSYYYFHSPLQENLTEAEALVQSVLVAVNNPRPVRMLKESLKAGKVSWDDIVRYAKKYGLREVVEKGVAMNA